MFQTDAAKSICNMLYMHTAFAYTGHFHTMQHFSWLNPMGKVSLLGYSLCDVWHVSLQCPSWFSTAVYISCCLTVGIRKEISSQISYDIAWLPILYTGQPHVFALTVGLVHVSSCTSFPMQYILPVAYSDSWVPEWTWEGVDDFLRQLLTLLHMCMCVCVCIDSWAGFFCWFFFPANFSPGVFVC